MSDQTPNRRLKELQALVAENRLDDAIAEIRPRLKDLDVRFHLLHAQCSLRKGDIYLALHYLEQHAAQQGGNSYFCYTLAVAASLVADSASALADSNSRRALALDARREHLEYYLDLALSVGASPDAEIRRAFRLMEPDDFRGAEDARSVVPVRFDRREGRSAGAEITVVPAAPTFYEHRAGETATVDKPAPVVTSPVSFFALDNATLYFAPGMDGLIQREDGTFLGEGPTGHLNPHGNAWARRYGQHIYLNHEAMERAYGPPRALDGEHVAPFRLAGDYYFHFLFETLTAMRRATESLPGVPIVLPDYEEIFTRIRRPVWQEMIASLGLPAGALVTPPRGVYRVARLHVPNFWGYGDHALSDSLAEEDGSGSTVLYVTRRGAATRQLRNEAEVCAALRERFGEIEIAQLEQLSFAEQRRLFAQSRIVCGPHGGGLANLLFCRPGATVLELHTLGAIPCFSHISYLKGLRYRAYAPRSAGGHNAAFSVDIAKFKLWLDDIDAGTA